SLWNDPARLITPSTARRVAARSPRAPARSARTRPPARSSRPRAPCHRRTRTIPPTRHHGASSASLDRGAPVARNPHLRHSETRSSRVHPSILVPPGIYAPLRRFLPRRRTKCAIVTQATRYVTWISRYTAHLAAAGRTQQKRRDLSPSQRPA